MQSSHLPHISAAHPVAWGTVVKRTLAAAAAILALSSTAGCMVEAMYAVPIALDGAASTIARALPPVDETKYIVRAQRVPPGEPLLAKAPPAQSTASALADASQRPQIPAATLPAQPASPTMVVESPAPMPVFTAGALARRTRM